MLERIKTERLSDRVSEVISNMILEGEFKPGDRFLSESVLTQRLGVSRSSVREALRSLETTGWISVKQGKGIFIASTSDRSDEGFQGWLESNKESVLEHFEIRLILDPKAAAYAARKADAADIRELKDICEEFKATAAAGDAEALIRVDERFHYTLARCTRNKTLYVLMRTMAKSLSVGWRSSLHVPGRGEKSIEEHYAIVRAIEARDPGAAEKAMTKHLEKAMREILEFMERR